MNVEKPSGSGPGDSQGLTRVCLVLGASRRTPVLQRGRLPLVQPRLSPTSPPLLKCSPLLSGQLRASFKPASRGLSRLAPLQQRGKGGRKRAFTQGLPWVKSFLYSVSCIPCDFHEKDTHLHFIDREEVESQRDLSALPRTHS